MKSYYSPGCAFIYYKPDLAKRVEEYLVSRGICEGSYIPCCLVKPDVPENTRLISTCAGCGKQYRDYGNVDEISLWEVLLEADFPFPRYDGEKISIHDACPARKSSNTHDSVRECLVRMGFDIVECEKNRDQSVCCGDSFYATGDRKKIFEAMTSRAKSMPEEQVAVYCVSCIKSMEIGGKKPRYLVDLIFGETTDFSADYFKYHEDLEEIHKKFV